MTLYHIHMTFKDKTYEVFATEDETPLDGVSAILSQLQKDMHKHMAANPQFRSPAWEEMWGYENFDVEEIDEAEVLYDRFDYYGGKIDAHESGELHTFKVKKG